jgi:hypothetical protein
VKLTTNLHPSAEVKNAWSYTSTPPIRLHGVVLSRSTRTTLPLPFSYLSLCLISFSRNMSAIILRFHEVCLFLKAQNQFYKIFARDV